MTLVHLTIIALVAGLVFPAIASYEAVYVAMGAMLIGMLSLPRDAVGVTSLLAYRFLLLAFLLLAVAMAVAWTSVDDAVILAVLIPILLAAGLTVLMRHTRYDIPGMAGGLALAGGLAAAGFGAYDVFVGAPRAGVGNNPIHYAALATILGFFALIGLFGSTRKDRFLVLLGPPAALASALFSGSRGPLLAVLVLGLLLAPLLLRHFWRPQRAFRLAISIGFVGMVFVIVAGLVLSGTGLRLFNVLMSLGDGGNLDASSQIRAMFWQSGWAAFLERPLFGHGASHIYAAASAHFPTGFAEQYNVHRVHLHSDVLDFAVAGGLFGVAALFLILSAPFALLRGQRDPERRAMLFTGALVLGPGYFLLGLTNATIGILPQTALFGVGLGVLMALSQPQMTSE